MSKLIDLEEVRKLKTKSKPSLDDLLSKMVDFVHSTAATKFPGVLIDSIPLHSWDEQETLSLLEDLLNIQKERNQK